MDGKKTNALILAAGISSRMGSPKFNLKLADGRTFLESLLRQYLDFGCEKIAVVLNTEGIKSVVSLNFPDKFRIKLIENPSPEKGRFLSIQLGLKATDSRNPVFIQNIDNPFAPLAVLEKLITSLGEDDFVKPVFEGKGGHPVLIGPQMIKVVLEKDFADLNFKKFLETFNGAIVEVEDDSILININTKDEYQDLLSDFSIKKVNLWNKNYPKKKPL